MSNDWENDLVFAASNTRSSMAPMRLADLKAIQENLLAKYEESRRKVFVFPGTMDDLKKAMMANDIVVTPPYFSFRTLYGLECHEILSNRIVLIGAHDIVWPIVNDTVQLELARQKAYPESVIHV